MSSSDKIDRVMAVLSGQRPDRPPVSFWYHFEAHQRHGPEAIQAHLEHARSHDLDFVKVMNDNGYPKPKPIKAIEDLRALTVLNGDEPEFARQLELLEALAKEFSGRLLMATTVFNAWATLRRLIKPKDKPGPPKLTSGGEESDLLLSEFLTRDRQAVAEAVRVVGESLANFAAKCVSAGADGVFLSVRDDWINTAKHGASTYDELVRPADLRILEGASAGRFNLLHVCGVAADFDRFANYPVHVINWADRAAGPSIAEVIAKTRSTICGGVDNLDTLPNGTPEQCAAEVRDALAQAGDRPILIAPGCTFDPQRVPRENLEALCQTVRAL